MEHRRRTSSDDIFRLGVGDLVVVGDEPNDSPRGDVAHVARHTRSSSDSLFDVSSFSGVSKGSSVLSGSRGNSAHALLKSNSSNSIVAPSSKNGLRNIYANLSPQTSSSSVREPIGVNMLSVKRPPRREVTSVDSENVRERISNVRRSSASVDVETIRRAKQRTPSGGASSSIDEPSKELRRDRRSSMSDDSIPLTSNGTQVEDNVRVLVRVRPPLPREYASVSKQFLDADPVGKTVALIASSVPNSVNVPSKVFRFDHVVTEEFTQEDVFNRLGRPVTNYCLKGYHCTVFAYGQTGSGKTFTIQGPQLSDERSTDRGLMPRVFEYLFAKKEHMERGGDNNTKSSVSIDVFGSFLEIYNDQVFDLLGSNSKKTLQIREHPEEGVYVEGLTKVNLTDVSTALELMKRGVATRRVAETSMNRESSRSHSVFTLSLHIQRTSRIGISTELVSRFHLCDLAGSERLDKAGTGSVSSQTTETTSINQSLSALGNVIIALADVGNGKSRHIPYRDSKLTFLLKDSLAQNALTFVVANVSPSILNAGETVSTLQFASRAKRIRLKAHVNRVMSKEALLKENEELKLLVKRLRDRFQSALSSTIERAEAAAASPEVKPVPNCTTSSTNDEKGSGEKSADSDDMPPMDRELMRQLVVREKKASEEVARMSEELKESQALMEKLNTQRESHRLMLKMRDDAINVMREKLDSITDVRSSVAGPFETALKLEIGRLRREIEAKSSSDPEMESLLAEKSVQIVELQNEVTRLKEAEDSSTVRHMNKLNELNAYLTNEVIRMQDDELAFGETTKKLQTLTEEMAELRETHELMCKEKESSEAHSSELRKQLREAHDEMAQLRVENEQVSILRDEFSNLTAVNRMMEGQMVELENELKEERKKKKGPTPKLHRSMSMSNVPQINEQEAEQYKQAAHMLKLCLERAVDKEHKLKEQVEELERSTRSMASEILDKSAYVDKCNEALVQLTGTVNTLEELVSKQNVLLERRGITPIPQQSNGVG